MNDSFKYILLVSFLYLCPLYSQAQRPSNKAKHLATRIIKDAKNDHDKVLKIFEWCISHISYDVKVYSKRIDRNQNANVVLRKRKGVCSGYSNLFGALCSAINIPNEQVVGFAKGFEYRPGDRFYYENHEWNVVYYDSSWHLMDVTWGAGYLNRAPRKFHTFVSIFFPIAFINSTLKFIRHSDYRYFNADTSWFLQEHLPILSMWQLKRCPITYNEFEGSTINTNACEPIAFESKIQYYRSLSKSQRLLFLGDQSKLNNTYSNLVKAKNYHQFNKTLNKKLLTKELTTLDTVLKYGSHFFSDNNQLHKYNKDTIFKRTLLNINHLNSVSRKNITEMSKHSKALYASIGRINGLEKLIGITQNKNKNRKQKDIKSIRRPLLIKEKYKAKNKHTVEQLKNGYIKDIALADSLKKVFFALNDSILTLRKSQIQLQSVIYDLMNESSTLIKIRTDENIDLCSMSKLSKLQSDFIFLKQTRDSLFNHIRITDHKIKRIGTLSSYLNKKYITYSMRGMEKLKMLKKNSLTDFQEELIFSRVQLKLFDFYNTSIPLLEEELKDANEDLTWSIMNHKLLDKELYYLKIEAKVVIKWKNKLIKMEQSRYKYFTNMNKNMIKEVREVSLQKDKRKR